MKSIDFSKPGGFPLTQDQLGYMQSSYNEALNGLASAYGPGPMVISGVEVTKTSSGVLMDNYSVTEGWVVYNGEMVRIPAAAITIDAGLNRVYFEINRTSTPLTYNDGNTYNVVNDVTGTLAELDITTPDSSIRFALNNLQRHGKETFFSSLSVSSPASEGGLTGNILYKKNFLNNTIELSALLGCTNAQNLVTSATRQPYLLGTLPEGYRPTRSNYFIAQTYSFLTARYKDDLGINWLDRINCSLIYSGDINAYLMRPESTTVSFAFVFSAIISLD